MRVPFALGTMTFMLAALVTGCQQPSPKTEEKKEAPRVGTPAEVVKEEVADLKGEGAAVSAVAGFVGVYDRVPGKELAEAMKQGKVQDAKWTLTIREDGTFSQAVELRGRQSVIRGKIELVGKNLKRVIEAVDDRKRDAKSTDTDTLPLLVPSEGGKVLTEDTESQKWVRRE